MFKHDRHTNALALHRVTRRLLDSWWDSRWTSDTTKTPILFTRWWVQGN